VPPERPPGVPPGAEIGFGLRPSPLPAPGHKSGQFICYKTGQIKKLATWPRAGSARVKPLGNGLRKSENGGSGGWPTHRTKEK